MHKKLSLIFLTLLFISCSTKKEPIVSLKPLKAKFNILFNGNLFLEEGINKFVNWHNKYHK